jgi:hypothetical protein
VDVPGVVVYRGTKHITEKVNWAGAIGTIVVEEPLRGV